MALLLWWLGGQSDYAMLLLRGKKSAVCPDVVDPANRRYLVVHSVFASV
jgi:hypothetical protein